jgi:hypothetical protein
MEDGRIRGVDRDDGLGAGGCQRAVFAKLQVPNRTQAVAAIRHGTVHLD